MIQFYEQFLLDIHNTRWYEYMAVAAGLISVWYSQRENVLLYPIGLVNTITYVFITIKGRLLGEASVNFYYTIMSIIGWVMWAKKDTYKKPVLQITASNSRELQLQFLFFTSFYAVIFIALTFFKTIFFDGVIPWADAFASATAFTGMWLMTKKKIESWYWWMATNIASIPLFFVKHYSLTSVYYVVLLIMSFYGLAAWQKKLKNQSQGLSSITIK